MFIDGEGSILNVNLEYNPSDELQLLNNFSISDIRLFDDNQIIIRSEYQFYHAPCHSSYWSTYDLIDQELVQYGPDQWHTD